MELTESQITSIIYEKDGGDKSARVIIPTAVPKDLIRAIDVSELDPAEREKLVQLYKEYKEYTAGFMKTMFSFENWASQTHQVEIKPKWRAFKVSGLR